MTGRVAYISLHSNGAVPVRSGAYVVSHQCERPFRMRALMVSPYTLRAGFRIQVVVGFQIVLHTVPLDAIAREWRGIGWVPLVANVQTRQDLTLEASNEGPEPRALEVVAVGREYDF